MLTFLSLGYLLGDRWQSASENIHHYITIGILGLAGALALYLLARYLLKKRS